jgi:hypothetical protein
MQLQCSLKSVDMNLVTSEFSLLTLEQHCLRRLRIEPIDTLDLCIPFAKCTLGNQTLDTELQRVTQAFRKLLARDFESCMRSLVTRLRRTDLKTKPHGW